MESSSTPSLAPEGSTQAQDDDSSAQPLSSTPAAAAQTGSLTAESIYELLGHGSQDATYVSAGFQDSPSDVERLPPEIRRRILISNPTVESLRALVHASPTFHQQYALDKRVILSSCLEASLGDAFVDAYTAHLSSQLAFLDNRDGPLVTEFLASYEERAKAWKDHVNFREITVEDIVQMTAFYLTVMQPVMKDFVSWCATADDGLAGCLPAGSAEGDARALSGTERTRILRALYRFQICCNCFGKAQALPPPRCRADSTWHIPGSILRDFFSRFEPWEAEEILCVHSFVRGRYMQTFKTLTQHSHDWFSRKPRLAPDNSRPLRFVIRDPVSTGSYLTSLSSDGLDFLSTVRGTSDLDKLAETVAGHMRHLTYYFVETSVSEFCIRNHFAEAKSKSARYRAQDAREKLEFAGDAAPAGPPLAWTTMWKGTYSNLYGCFIPEGLRRWGYIMWDASRMRETEAMRCLVGEIKRAWGEERDPRDHFDIRR